MTQAILYGPIPEVYFLTIITRVCQLTDLSLSQNPFEFRFANDVNGHHLMAAAEQLSREILGSSKSFQPASWCSDYDRSFPDASLPPLSI